MCPDFRYHRRIQPQLILSTLTVIISWGSLPIYPKASNTDQIPLDLIVPTYLSWLLPSAPSSIIQPDRGVRTWTACPSFQPSAHLSDPNRHDQSDPTMFLRSHFSENFNTVGLVQRNIEANYQDTAREESKGNGLNLIYSMKVA